MLFYCFLLIKASCLKYTMYTETKYVNRYYFCHVSCILCPFYDMLQKSIIGCRSGQDLPQDLKFFETWASSYGPGWPYTTRSPGFINDLGEYPKSNMLLEQCAFKPSRAYLTKIFFQIINLNMINVPWSYGPGAYGQGTHSPGP